MKENPKNAGAVPNLSNKPPGGGSKPPGGGGNAPTGDSTPSGGKPPSVGGNVPSGGSTPSGGGAKTRPIKVRLDQLVLMTALFGHRDDLELSEAQRLRSLAESIAAEGLQTPIEVFVDENGRIIVTKGHRRVSALRLLANDKRPGFTLSMEVAAIEVVGATLEELVVRSVVDNAHRLGLNPTERIRAGKSMFDIGVKGERAAAALEISLKTYERDLLIAQNDWMFDLVFKNCITPSHASTLLAVATTEKRLAELREDLMAWVAKTKLRIDEETKTKDLSSSAQLVKTSLTKQLFNHWVAQLRKKERFNTLVPDTLEIAIDADANKVSFKAIDIYMMKVSQKDLAKMISDVESAKNVMLQYLKSRNAVEGAKGPQDLAREETEKRSSGLTLLRDAGLSNLADDVERELKEEAENAQVTTPMELAPDTNEGA